MARNVEIKARIDSIAGIEPRVLAIADSGPRELLQDDTFFRCEAGRLKLRTQSPQSGELIFYCRSDEPGPKESFYVCSPISSPESVRELLSQAYGATGRVVKRRILYLVGRTRIHLDYVQDLGEFVELEVVLREEKTPEEGVREAHERMRKLGIESVQLIDCAYVDLLDRIKGR